MEKWCQSHYTSCNRIPKKFCNEGNFILGSKRWWRESEYTFNCYA